MNSALVLLWACAAWRLIAAYRGNRAREQISLGALLAFLAAAATIWVYSAEIEQTFPNASGLMMRYALAGAYITGRPAIDYFLADRTGLQLNRRRVIAVTVTVLGTCTVLWVIAPVHDPGQIIRTSPDPVVHVYTIVSYLWVLSMLTELGYLGIRGFITLTDDLPGRVAFALFALASLEGAALIVAMTVDSFATPGERAPTALTMTIAALVPVAIATIAAGLLAAPLLSWLARQLHAAQRIRALYPRWRRVRALRPDLVMPLRGALFDAPTVAHRMRIEILDFEAAGHG